MPLSLQQPPAEDLGILRGVKGDSRPPQPPWGGRRAAGPDVFRGRDGGGDRGGEESGRQELGTRPGVQAGATRSSSAGPRGARAGCVCACVSGALRAEAGRRGRGTPVLPGLPQRPTVWTLRSSLRRQARRPRNRPGQTCSLVPKERQAAGRSLESLPPSPVPRPTFLSTPPRGTHLPTKHFRYSPLARELGGPSGRPRAPGWHRTPP